MIALHKVNVPDLDSLMTDLRGVISSGWVGEGPKVAEFEKALAPIVGSDHVTAVNSGTSALTLALRLAGVGPGDEVITTPITCAATNLPIVLAGATPIWADVQPRTGNICPESITDRVTDRTKAIMAVHWGGYPCDMDEIRDAAKWAGVPVIEDAAHALGGSYAGMPIGTGSDFVCFSFQAIKHLHTGDGGALVCRRPDDHARARRLRWFGIDRENRKRNEYGIDEWNITEAGYKFHMNDIAATIGLSQISGLNEIISERQCNAALYNEAFQNLRRVKLIDEKTDRSSPYWLYTLLVDDQVGFIKYMTDLGIGASIVHSRNDRNAVFAGLPRFPLPGVDEFASKMVCIPVGQWLTEKDRSEIIEAVRSEAW